LTDSVILTGNRSDVAELMQAMDTLAFPSLWEGLPTTVVEAQATGLPCIISDRITEDVDLSPLVQRLSIDNTALWAKVLAYPQPRQNVQSDIIASGFEINSAAAKLSQLYESLYS
jgi:glycosyltransferase involved in cell wall biosynthesis